MVRNQPCLEGGAKDGEDECSEGESKVVVGRVERRELVRPFHLEGLIES